MSAAADQTQEKSIAELTIKKFMRDLIAEQIAAGEELPEDIYYSLAKGKIGFKEFFDQFYAANDQGDINSKGFLPSKLAAWIADNVPYFVLKEDMLLFVYKNGYYAADPQENLMRVVIKTLLKPTERKESRIKEVLSHVEHRANKTRPYEDCNLQPEYYICFKNGMYDVKNRCMLPHDPKYFCLNQIPHEYDPAATPKGETVDRYLLHICPADDDRKMLLTFAGYMMTCNTEWQKFITIYGQPNSGKSTLIKLLSNMCGEENGAALSLEQICDDTGSKFAKFTLTGKLFNLNADLRADMIKNPASIKLITGEDNLTVERKHGSLISTKIYARFMFSANDLPSIQAKDDAFFRRVWVLFINALPSKIDTGLSKKLNAEIDRMLHLCVGALEAFYADGEKLDALESANSIKYRTEWQRQSDTVTAFIYDERPFSESAAVKSTVLYNAYKDYCEKTDRAKHTNHNFYKSLATKNFTKKTINGVEYYEAPEKYRLKKDFSDAEETPFT